MTFEIDSSDVNVRPVFAFAFDDDQLELQILFAFLGLEGELGRRLLFGVLVGDGLAVVLGYFFEVFLVESPFAFRRFVSVLECSQSINILLGTKCYLFSIDVKLNHNFIFNKLFFPFSFL